MRQFIIILGIFLVTFLTALATEQFSDILIIGKEKIYLQSFPFEEIKVDGKKLPPPFIYNEKYSSPHTGCYRGYVATWQVIDDCLLLTKVEKLDSEGTPLNVIEYLEKNGYRPVIKDGFVLADWYSDTLKIYSTRYNDVFNTYGFFLSKDYLREKDKKIELAFNNGKLVINNILPIESYTIGDILCFDVYYFQDWLIGYKKIQIEGIINYNNGKMVRLKLLSLGTDRKSAIGKIKEIIKDFDNCWVNPRYCKKK